MASKLSRSRKFLIEHNSLCHITEATCSRRERRNEY
jgi:hypothetical protein